MEKEVLLEWFLKDERLEDSSTIPNSKLEKAKTWDTVDLMTQNYTPPGAVEVTKQVLKKMKRNDLVLKLEPKGQSQKDKNMKRHLFRC